jgi:DNA-binding HxlR family transcriptional regulator
VYHAHPFEELADAVLGLNLKAIIDRSLVQFASFARSGSVGASSLGHRGSTWRCRRRGSGLGDLRRFDNAQTVGGDGITHKALADALKRLERNGLISRRVLPTQPIGVEYAVTALGGSLREPFAALYDWVLTNGCKMEQAQGTYDELRLGNSCENLN